MAYYNLYRSSGEMVNIPALLEDHADGGESITFQKILRWPYGSYDPVILRIPAELEPEVYETIYGDHMIQLKLPKWADKVGNDIADLRLAVETVGGKKYAYIDWRQIDPDQSNRIGTIRYRGKPIRARFEIQEVQS